MLSSWWKRLVLREPPLVPGATSGRSRTYSADSGYVYEYRFAGFRQVRQRGEQSHQYVFHLTTGRGPEFTMTICLRQAQLRESVALGRELTASERHGIATIALKRALDATDHPALLEPEITPDRSELTAIGEILDL